MRNYKEHLKFYKDNIDDYSPYRVIASLVVNEYMDVDAYDKLFEPMCRFIYDWCQDTEMDEYELADVILRLEEEGELKLNDFADYDNWDGLTDILNRNI